MQIDYDLLQEIYTLWSRYLQHIPEYEDFCRWAKNHNPLPEEFISIPYHQLMPRKGDHGEGRFIKIATDWLETTFKHFQHPKINDAAPIHIDMCSKYYLGIFRDIFLDTQENMFKRVEYYHSKIHKAYFFDDPVTVFAPSEILSLQNAILELSSEDDPLPNSMQTSEIILSRLKSKDSMYLKINLKSASKTTILKQVDKILSNCQINDKVDFNNYYYPRESTTNTQILNYANWLDIYGMRLRGMTHSDIAKKENLYLDEKGTNKKTFRAVRNVLTRLDRVKKGIFP